MAMKWLRSDAFSFGSKLQVGWLENEGYYGVVRLLMAICKVVRNYCKDNGIDLHGRNFTLSYDTNIPHQVYKCMYV